jgi:hypothetical protein
MDVKWIYSGNYSPLHDSCFIKRTNIIGQALILSSMTLVLSTVAEKVAVKLLQMIFRDRDFGKGMEDVLHDFGVPANFNLYTGLYTFDFLSVAGSINGFNASNFAFDTTGFTAPDGALNGGSWSVGVDGNALALTYTVPEPSTYALLGLGAVALVIAARRKRAA